MTGKSIRSGNRPLLSQKMGRRGYLYILPWLLGFAFFFLYPLVYSVLLAFSDITDLRSFQLEFAGWANFRKALSNDMTFLPALSSSLKDLIRVPISIVYSFAVANLLHRKFPGRTFFCLIFLLPLLLGTSVVMQVLEGNQASVNLAAGMSPAAGEITQSSFRELMPEGQLLSLLGPGLSGPLAALVGRFSEVMWLSGIQIIIFLGALQGIPESLYDAADLDGFSSFDKLWKITLPLSLPAIELNLVFSVLDSFTNSDNPVMTYVTNVSFSNLQLSYGSAIAWMYFLIIGILLAVSLLLVRRIARPYQ